MSSTHTSNVDVFIESDNRTSVRLLDCDKEIDLSSVEKVSIDLLNGASIDSDTYPRMFSWKTIPSVVVITPGRYDMPLETGVYRGQLYIYDDRYDLGLMFGSVRLFVTNRS